MTKIAVVVGSIREGSINKKLAKNLERLSSSGTEFEYLDIASLPLFNQDIEAESPSAPRLLKEIIEAADAVLFVTPEYNHAFPGVLKNAIDWGSRPWANNSWRNKPTGIVGASMTESGTKFAQAALTLIVDWFESPLYTDKKIMITVDEDTFDDDGKLRSDIEAEAKTYIDGFIAWVNNLAIDKNS